MWSILTTHSTTVPHSSHIIVVTKHLGSHNHRQNNPSPKIFLARFFSNPYSSVWTLHQDRRSLSSLPMQKSPASGSSRASTRRPTRWQVRACDSVSGRRTSPPESPVINLLAYVPGFLIQHLHLHFFLCFVSNSYTFLGFLDFSNTQQHLQDFESCFILEISYSCDLLLFGIYSYQRFNVFSHFGCIYCYCIGEISCIPLMHSSIQICIHCVCTPAPEPSPQYPPHSPQA